MGTFGLGLAAFLLLSPVLAVTHEVLVLGVAELLGGLGALAHDRALLRTLPLDPIYTGAFLLTLGGIEARGMAVAEPLGGMLVPLWPAFFEPARLVAPGAWASAVVAPGATIVSRWAAVLAADAAVLGAGGLAVRAGRGGRTWLVVLGAIVQMQVIVGHTIDAPPDLVDLEAAGIPFALAMIVSGDVQSGPRVAVALAALPPAARDALLGLGMVAVAYVPVMLGFALLALLGRGKRPALRLPRGGLSTALSLLVGVGIAASPLGALADAQTHFLSAADDATVTDLGAWSATSGDSTTNPTSAASGLPADVLAGQASAARTLAPDAPTTVPAELSAATMPAAAPPEASAARPVSGARSLPEPSASPASPAVPPTTSPSTVAVTGEGYQYAYAVNGEPQQIRGLGYNVQYRDLPPDERARRLDRDFELIRRAGANTIFGWDPREFDATLLDIAHRHGLGVAPPFELNPDADYTDPAVRAQIEADVLAWVERYRAHPALRMWAVGNEVLHKLVYPSWMPVRSDPEWENRARAFARFYATLLDRIRDVDPTHPVVYRDAEDAYVRWMRDELAREPRRPWFVYGINSYTPRLAEILSGWPDRGFDVPLLVSEFAPGGMSPSDRPQGFRAMWGMVRAADAYVLGGSVYAWTTDGPEEVDRVFGLTGDDGRPVDGALATVAAMFRGSERMGFRVPPNITPPPEERVRALARQSIEAVKAGDGAAILAPEASASILGDLATVSADPLVDGDIRIERSADPRRIAWGEGEGITAEWWVTWATAREPDRTLTLIVRERVGGALSVDYIYHGPA